MDSFKKTRIVTKVPTKYHDGRLRYWCNHCKDSHDTTVGLGRHYREWHQEHVMAERGSWVKRSYQDLRHGITNDSDYEKGKELDNTYDEQSDESDYDPSGRPEGEEGERVEDEPDDENENEHRPPTQPKPRHIPAAVKVTTLFDIAAHGKLGPEVNAADFTRMAAREMRKLDEEEDSRRMDPYQDAGDGDDEGEGGARGPRRGRRARAALKEETHKFAKQACNISPYK